MSNRVGYLRRERGMSQSEFANKIGLSIQILSYIESGLLDPNAGLAKMIARALGCRTDELFTDDPPYAKWTRGDLTLREFLEGTHVTDRSEKENDSKRPKLLITIYGDGYPLESTIDSIYIERHATYVSASRKDGA